MTQFAIAGVQLNAAAGDNLEAIRRVVTAAKRRFPWVDMVVLGELAAKGGSVAAAEPLPGPTEEYFCTLARKLNLWMVNGSLYELHQGEVYNTASVINPHGEVVVRHRKLYPFLPYEQGVSAGNQHTIFDIQGVGRFGVSICYDMWFPETTRAMCSMGAEVILHPTLTNTADRDLELAIARTSAGVNQCYFFDVNSCGELGNGRSIIVGPDGDVLRQAGECQDVMTTVVDFNRVRRSRERGVLALGQPLKSFRDSTVQYPQYSTPSKYLSTLGPLVVPGKL
ncbi:carbon-nitrogen hydrolase family protein [Marinobacter sp. X15-166B]|uniref:carbon-nitrogen hydrolase family protein n=1 Tax=Marinobacter sp. X15-166B TaxID=1897620 RepID=UPI00085C43BB|nr:carbon-nitrogen hydrolase family protein [Marinobacter sp. X15-166B]OEY67485.1 hydrolase [Marinobacter sp. X15-166B]